MSMPTGSILMALLFLSSLLVMQCSAQDTVFQWSFADNSSSAGIVPCQRARIAAHAFSRDVPSIGRPPYYMAAYPLDGSPTVTFVGMDPSHLSWEVNYPAGSQLMLALVDADGNSGGVMPSILTVADGGSSSCLPHAISSVPSVTANVTQDLAPCEPLGLTIRGSTRPYTVSVVGIDSAISNFTLGPRDDIFAWTNQASADTDVLFAVSDASGNWASHSAFFKAALSPSQCSRPTWRSFASDSVADASGSGVSQSSPSRHQITVIVGACLGVAVAILLICLAILFLCLRRRGIMARRCMDGQDVIPRTWADERAITISRRTSKLDLDLTLDFADDMHSRTASPYTASTPVRVPSPVFKPHAFSDVLDISAENRPLSPAPSSSAQCSVPADPPQRIMSPVSSCPTSPDVRPRPLPIPRVSSPPLSLTSDAHHPIRTCTTPSSISSRPLPSIPQPHVPLSRKAREALGTDARLRSVRSAGDVRRAATSPMPARPSPLHRPRSLVFAEGAVRESWAQDGAGRELVVIQHRDGAVVQELPPPYDECLRSPSYPSSPSLSPSSPLYPHSHPHSHSRSYSQS